LEEECKTIVKKKENIQEYQKTLDMGQIEQFNNVEEARQAMSYRIRLWRALIEWKACINRWETDPFEDIEVEEITTKSDKLTKTVI
jgi:hypothetical protein